MIKKHYILLPVLLVSSVVASCAPAASTQIAREQSQAEQPTSTRPPLVTVVPTATQNPTPQPPISNSVYYGTFEGKKLIFVTLDIWQSTYRQYFLSYEYFGKLYVQSHNAPQWFDVFDFNFKEIEQPELLFTRPTIFGIDFLYHNELAYISGFGVGDVQNSPSFIYEVDLSTGSSNELWSGPLGKVTNASGNHLVIHLLRCYGCDSPPLRDYVIVNIITGAEKTLTEVEAPHINSENGTFSYHFVVPVQVPCEGGQGCSGGFTTEYEATGEVFVEPLP